MAVQLPSLAELQRAGDAMRAKMVLKPEITPGNSRRASTSTQEDTGGAAVKLPTFAATTGGKKRKRAMSVVDDGAGEVDELASTPREVSVEPDAEVRPAKKQKKAPSKKKKVTAIKGDAVSAGEERESTRQGRSTTPRRRSASVASEHITLLAEDGELPLKKFLSNISKRNPNKKPLSREPTKERKAREAASATPVAPDTQPSTSKGKSKRKSVAPASDQDPDDTFAHIPPEKVSKAKPSAKGKEKATATDADVLKPKKKQKKKSPPAEMPAVEVSEAEAPVQQSLPKKKRKSVAAKEKEKEASAAEQESTTEPPKKKKKALTPASGSKLPVEPVPAPIADKPAAANASKAKAVKPTCAKGLSAKAKPSSKKPFVPPVSLPPLSATPFSMQATVPQRPSSPPLASTSRLPKFPAVLPTSDESSSSSEEEATAAQVYKAAVQRKKPITYAGRSKKGQGIAHPSSQPAIEEIPPSASEEEQSKQLQPEVEVAALPRQTSTQSEQPQLDLPEPDVEPIERVQESDEEMDNMPQDLPDMPSPRAASISLVEEHNQAQASTQLHPSRSAASPVPPQTTRSNASAVPQIDHPASLAIDQTTRPARSVSPLAVPQPAASPIHSTRDIATQITPAVNRLPAASQSGDFQVPQLRTFSFPSMPDNINFGEALQTTEGRQAAEQMLRASNDMMREMARLTAVYQAGFQALLGVSASLNTNETPSAHPSQRQTTPPVSASQDLPSAPEAILERSLSPVVPARTTLQPPPAASTASRQPSPAPSQRHPAPLVPIPAVEQPAQPISAPEVQQTVEDVSMEAVPAGRRSESPAVEQSQDTSRILVPETSQQVPSINMSAKSSLLEHSQPEIRKSPSPEPVSTLQQETEATRKSPVPVPSPSTQLAEQLPAPSAPDRRLSHTPRTVKSAVAPSPVPTSKSTSEATTNEPKAIPATSALAKLASGAVSSSEEDSDESDSAAEGSKPTSRRLSSLPLPHLPSAKKAESKPTASPIDDDDAEIKALIRGGRPRISLADIPLSSPPPSDHESSDPELEGQQTPDMVLSSREPSPGRRRYLKQIEKARAASVSESEHDSDQDVPQPVSDSEDEMVKGTPLLSAQDGDDILVSVEAETAKDADDREEENHKSHSGEIGLTKGDDPTTNALEGPVDSDTEMANADTVLDAKKDADAVMENDQAQQTKADSQVAGSETSQDHAEDTAAPSPTSSDSLKEQAQIQTAEQPSQTREGSVQRRASSEISEGIEEPIEEAPFATAVEEQPPSTQPAREKLLPAPTSAQANGIDKSALAPEYEQQKNRAASPAIDRERAQSYSVFGAEGKEIASYFAGTPSRGQSRERMPTPALMGDDEQALAAAREAALGFEDSQSLNNGIQSSQVGTGFLNGYQKQFRGESEPVFTSSQEKRRTAIPAFEEDDKPAEYQPTPRAVSSQPRLASQEKQALVDSQTDELASQPAPRHSSPIEDSQVDELENSFVVPNQQAAEDPSPPATRVHFRSSPTPAPEVGGNDEDEDSDEEEIEEKQTEEPLRMSRQSTADSSNEIQMSLTGSKAKSIGGLARAVVPEVLTDPEETEDEVEQEENTQATPIENPNPLFADSSSSSEEEEVANTPRALPRLGGFDMSQASVRPQPRQTRSGSNGYQTSSVRSQPRLSQLGDAKLRQQRKLELARSHSQSSMVLHVKPKAARKVAESSGSSSSSDESDEQDAQPNIAGKRKPKKTAKNIWK